MTQSWLWGSQMAVKKSNTCEEGGAHPRISVWHLLMNLKNNYLLKKLLKWANKKCILTFTKIQKIIIIKRKTPRGIITLYLCTNSLYDMIYSSWDIEFDRLKLVIMGHFLPFYLLSLKTQQIGILKKRKQLLEISSFYVSAPKTTNIWVTVPGIQSETGRTFCHFGSFFAILPL